MPIDIRVISRAVRPVQSKHGRGSIPSCGRMICSDPDVNLSLLKRARIIFRNLAPHGAVAKGHWTQLYNARIPGLQIQSASRRFGNRSLFVEFNNVVSNVMRLRDQWQTTGRIHCRENHKQPINKWGKWLTKDWAFRQQKWNKQPTKIGTNSQQKMGQTVNKRWGKYPTKDMANSQRKIWQTAKKRYGK